MMKPISAGSNPPEPETEELLELLALMYDRWENGVQCYEDAEDCAGFLGHAFKLSEQEESRVIAALKGVPSAARE